MPLRRRLLWWCPVLLAFASACAGGSEGSAPVSTPPTSSSPQATEAGQPAPTTAAPTTPAPMPTTPTTTTTSPEPATTAVSTLLDLEIVEWAEYPYANLADSTNRDTRLEMLVRNPNDLPVEIDTDALEVRLVNGAGNVVYANPNPTPFIWEGARVKGGETFPISACVCFDSSGLAREEWDTVDLVAPSEKPWVSRTRTT